MQGENESCMNSAMDFSAAERARRVRLILFDVDGVLTDGKIWTLPLGLHGKDLRTQRIPRS